VKIIGNDAKIIFQEKHFLSQFSSLIGSGKAARGTIEKKIHISVKFSVSVEIPWKTVATLHSRGKIFFFCVFFANWIAFKEKREQEKESKRRRRFKKVSMWNNKSKRAKFVTVLKRKNK
jgi:hypothetical protein